MLTSLEPVRHARAVMLYDGHGILEVLVSDPVICFASFIFISHSFLVLLYNPIHLNVKNLICLTAWAPHVTGRAHPARALDRLLSFNFFYFRIILNWISCCPVQAEVFKY